MMTPREQAELQAEVAWNGFLQFCKRGSVWIVITLCIVVFACNNGVETGPNATGSKYNVEQYNPSNLNIKG